MNDSALFGMLGLLIGGVLGILATWSFALRRLAEQAATISRHADLIGQLQAKRDKACDQVTPGANATVVRMARILKGEVE